MVRPECHAAPLRTRVQSWFRSCSHSRGPRSGDLTTPAPGMGPGRGLSSASRGRGPGASVGPGESGNSSGLLRVVSPAVDRTQAQGRDVPEAEEAQQLTDPQLPAPGRGFSDGKEDYLPPNPQLHHLQSQIPQRGEMEAEKTGILEPWRKGERFCSLGGKGHLLKWCRKLSWRNGTWWTRLCGWQRLV